MRALIPLILSLTIPLQAEAQAYRAENYLVVVPLTTTEFEVIEDRGEGPRGIWCAAASFAQQRLGAARASRIYVQQARGPSVSGVGRKGVVFTTREDKLTVPATQSSSLSVRVPGMGLPVHHARQFCIDYLLDIYDRF